MKYFVKVLGRNADRFDNISKKFKLLRNKGKEWALFGPQILNLF
jgi:hypothetical protein